MERNFPLALCAALIAAAYCGLLIRPHIKKERKFLILFILVTALLILASGPISTRVPSYAILITAFHALTGMLAVTFSRMILNSRA